MKVALAGDSFINQSYKLKFFLPEKTKIRGGNSGSQRLSTGQITLIERGTFILIENPIFAMF
jgi:hypothetical protein